MSRPAVFMPALQYSYLLPGSNRSGAMTKLGVNQPAQAQEMAAKYVAQHPNDGPGIKLLAFAELALNRPGNVEADIKPLLDTGHPDAETLDLQFNPISKFYVGPVQMKANNGVLIIDDFGRQRIEPASTLPAGTELSLDDSLRRPAPRRFWAM